MNTPESYLSQLQKRFPQLESRLKTFPSGAFFIEVDIGDAQHVVQYIPESGFAVFRRAIAFVGSEDDLAFPNFEDVLSYLLKIERTDNIQPF